jgi:hypothetical protein
MKRASDAKRRAARVNAVPSWANLAFIKIVYEGCEDGYRVDHIIPLVNKIVCGLHVPENLKPLTALENGKKHNKFDII